MKIAIVDDNPRDTERLKNEIDAYFKEKTLKYTIDLFERGLNFLDNVKQLYDVVFLDIDMPVIDGLEVSKKLRGLDHEVDIVFVTNYASLAINGYEVSASDFLVKPVKKVEVYHCIDKLIEKHNRHLKEKRLVVKSEGQYVVIKVNEIYYIEVMKHDVTFHTKRGDYVTRGVLRELENELSSFSFAMCSNCYLVNLNYVDSIDGDEVIVNKEALGISKSRKKEFMTKFFNSIEV